MRKTYIGIVRDHSGSMGSLHKGALKDYNMLINSIKQAAHDEATFVTVVECGYGRTSMVRRIETNTPIERMKEATEYSSSGTGTPLFDAVGELIEVMTKQQEIDKDDTAFLIMVITDGEENASKKYKALSISEQIRKLQASDVWTFTFRVPKGYQRTIVNLGIPSGNVIEWEQNERALEQSSQATQAAVSSFFTARSSGVRSTGSFYADVANIPVSTIKQTIPEVTHTAKTFSVFSDSVIAEFVTQKTGSYKIGHAFYELSKPETVQATKEIAIIDKQTGKIYRGAGARQMLNLPSIGNVRLKPGAMGQYGVYVQSTSVNRKLIAGTTLLYFW